jgi:hypothetical protein
MPQIHPCDPPEQNRTALDPDKPARLALHAKIYRWTVTIVVQRQQISRRRADRWSESRRKNLHAGSNCGSWVSAGLGELAERPNPVGLPFSRRGPWIDQSEKTTAFEPAQIAGGDASTGSQCGSGDHRIERLYRIACLTGTPAIASPTASPKGARLLAAPKAGDVVITAKLDRMFRSALIALDVLGQLHADLL